MVCILQPLSLFFLPSDPHAIPANDPIKQALVRLNRLVVILELAAVKVARGAEFVDLLRAHLLAVGLKSRAVEFTDLLQPLLVPLLLHDKEDGNAETRAHTKD